MEFHIRPLESRDAEGIAALRRMPGVLENTLGLTSYRTEQSEQFIANLGPDQHQFVAVSKNRHGGELIIGAAGLTVHTNPRTRHVGSLGIFVHPDFQGQGVGTAMLTTLLELADNWLMLVRVELEVYEDNEGAIRLYEQLGFEKEGLRRLATVRSGAYINEWLMSRLHPGFGG